MTNVSANTAMAQLKVSLSKPGVRGKLHASQVERSIRGPTAVHSQHEDKVEADVDHRNTVDCDAYGATHAKLRPRCMGQFEIHDPGVEHDSNTCHV